MTDFTLHDLEQMIKDRRDAAPDQSYTAQLLKKGVSKCAEKFGEEAIETIIAAIKGDSNEIAHEAADTLYHLLVLLSAHHITLDEVMKILAARTHQSGLEEKTSRIKTAHEEHEG